MAFSNGSNNNWTPTWNWEEMCGPDGLLIWSVTQRDIGICFQELYLQIPAFILLAIISAYYCAISVQRPNHSQSKTWPLLCRSIVTFLLAVCPVLRICIAVSSYPGNAVLIDYFLAAVEAISWLVHLGYTLSLQRQQRISHRGPVSLFVVWTLSFVLSAICLRSRYLLHQGDQYPQLLPFLTLFLGFSIAGLVLQGLYIVTLLPIASSTVGVSDEFVESRHIQNREREPLLGSLRHLTYSRFQEDHDPNDLGVALERTTFLGRLFFCWVNPLMEKGAKCKLNSPDDLYVLPLDMTPGYLNDQLDIAITGEIPPGQAPVGDESYGPVHSNPPPESAPVPPRTVSLMRGLHACFGWQFYGVGMLKLAADCAGFATPLLLNRLVNFIETRSEPLQNGYYYSAGLVAVTITSAFCNSHFSFLMSVVGLKIRAALITRIYRKTLTLSSLSLSQFSIGEIVNFMSTDTDRIVNSCPSFHAFWSIPFQIAVTLYLLYNQVGLAFLAGVGFTIVLIPINKCIASKIADLSTDLMSRKDDRVKMMAEVLRGIRTIKLHVWEDLFVSKLDGLRNKELKYLRGRKYLDALCVYFWATTPVLISILTFTTYVLLGNQLTAATVFTSMALLNMLISPLNTFPWVLNGLTEAWVSLKRIQRLLDLSDLDIHRYYSALPSPAANVDIDVRGASFSWGSNAADPQRPAMSNLEFSAKRGELIGVMGKVGSGKSSILAGIMAELELTSGTVGLADMEQGFGYVSQTPWLQRGTIRDNILFGKAYDESKYRAILHACCLLPDLDKLPNGDMTGVGEGGATLSGGQKARVALARAAYQDKGVYLLDDVLSAVDANVAMLVFSRCVSGLLQGKTRVFCTHQARYLLAADLIVVVDGGKVLEIGSPREVLKDCYSCDSPSDYHFSQAAGSRSRDSSETSSVGGDSLLDEEARAEGSVRLNVYSSYWQAVGNGLSAAIVLSMVLMQLTRNLTDWWLSYWVTHALPGNATEDGEYGGPDRETAFYLTVYGTLAVLNSVLTLIRAFLFAYGGIQAATRIHKRLLATVMRAQTYFFDVSPLGRILNRFSSDTYTIDDSLPFIVNILLAQLFGVLGTVAVVLYGLPWLVLVLAPLAPVYHYLQNQYRLTSRELKRLSSVTLSPVYSHFNETLMGLTTVRAFRAVPRFKRTNENNLEENLKCQFASQAAAQWLGLRLQFVGVALVAGVCLIAVLQHQYDIADPGLIGLAISYALVVTGMLSGVVNAFTETEKEMISVERACQYIDTVEGESCVETAPPYAWPSQGVVRFKDVELRYREHLDAALKTVSFETRPAEKLAVIGRTGAGKSSLLAAMFRLTELTSGQVSIDSVDISKIGLRGLRSRLAIIPQDPFIFSGTLQENIDPCEEHRSSELWRAIQRCHLSTTMRRLGGLGAVMEPGGSNLSAGQRQLICLVRAVLKNAKILCIDEATANVDQETDRHIQRLLRSCFRQSTVITIAHRVTTIMDAERVLVMADGEVLEFDETLVLMQNPDSYFYQIAQREIGN